MLAFIEVGLVEVVRSRNVHIIETGNLAPVSIIRLQQGQNMRCDAL